MKRPTINTRKGKRQFINALVENLRREIIARVPEMPQEWDGWELRWYLADRFKRACFGDDKSTARRKGEYNNTRMVKGL